jgi:hypothetical protein
MEVNGQLHAAAALPTGKSPRYPLDRRLRGPQSRSGHEEENSQPPPGIESRSSDRPGRSQSLYKLSYLGSELVKEVTISIFFLHELRGYSLGHSVFLTHFLFLIILSSFIICYTNQAQVQITLQLTVGRSVGRSVSQSVSQSWRRNPCGTYDIIFKCIISDEETVPSALSKN